MATITVSTRYSLMRFIFLLSLVALCVFLVSGCGADVVGGRKPTSTPKDIGVPTSPASTSLSGAEPTLEPYQFTDANGVPFPVPSTEANPIRLMTKEEAWGSSLPVKEIPALVDNDHLFLLRAVAADGKLIAGWIVPRSGTIQDATRLALMDVATRQITEVATVPASVNLMQAGYDSDSGSVYLDDGWLVWQDNNHLHAYNIATHNNQQIGMDSDVPIGIPGFFMLPSAGVAALDHGILVWVEGSGEAPEAGKVPSVLKSEDLSTGKVSVIGRHGADPHISWPYVAWYEPDLTKEVEGLTYSKPVVLNLQTGETQYFSERYHVATLALNGDTLLITNDGMVFLNNLSETRRQVIQPQQFASMTSGYTISDRLVAWYSEAPRVWDRVLQSLVIVGGYSGQYGSTLVAGNTLAWQSSPSYDDWKAGRAREELPSNFNIYLLDTSHLAK